jgi:hypothetical protein
VDWTKDAKTAAEQQAMERNMNQTLLSARISELRAPLQATRDRLSQALPSAADTIEPALEEVQQAHAQVNQITALRQERQLVQQALQVDNDAILTPLLDLYRHEKGLTTNLAKGIDAVKQRVAQAQHWHNQHTAAFRTLRDGTLAGIASQLKGAESPTLAPLLGIQEFLESVSQESTLNQARAAQADVRALFQQQTDRSKRVSELLTVYDGIARGYPAEIFHTNRFHVWQTLYEEVLANMDTVTLKAVFKQANASLPQGGNAKLLLSVAHSLEQLYQDGTSREHMFKDKLKGASSVELLKAKLDEQKGAVNSFATTQSASGSQAQYTCATEFALVTAMRDLLVRVRAVDQDLTQRSGNSLRSFRVLCECTREARLFQTLLNDVYTSQGMVPLQ